jgi:hypothetical protein
MKEPMAPHLRAREGSILNASSGQNPLRTADTAAGSPPTADFSRSRRITEERARCTAMKFHLP